MKRICLNCMKKFEIPKGYENEDFCCPFCGFIENTPPDIVNHLFPGTVLHDRYVIGVVLGHGGFGVTYKAWDQKFDTVVAIKEFFPANVVTRNPGEKSLIVYDGNKNSEYNSLLQRFLDEAVNIAKFQNDPNIVDVEEYFEENNTAYIVMEFLDGITLKDYLKQKDGKIEIDEALSIVMPILDALENIHKKGIVHRDISPDNIMLCGKSIKLYDFGAARFSDFDKETVKSIILKIGYAPPEQYREKSKQGPWTDIYALSAMLYQMLTGVIPDESTNRVLEDEVKDPKDINFKISENLNNTIMKGLAIVPDIRFQTVDEFRKALKNEIKVVHPKKRIGQLKKKRMIQIATAATLVIIGMGTFLSIYLSKYFKTHLRAATVKIWITYDDSSFASNIDERKSMFDDMSSDYIKQYESSGVKLEVEYIPISEYEDKLEEAKKNGNMPTLYMADDISPDLYGDATVLREVYSFLDMDEYIGLNEYKENGIDSIIPLGLSFPVAYVRRTNGVDLNTVEINSYDQISASEKGYYISPDDYAMQINSLGGKYTYEDKLVIDQKASDYISLLSEEVHNFSSMGIDNEEAVKKFIEEDIVYFMSSTDDFQMFNSEESGTVGIYEMRPLNTKNIYAEYRNFWTVDKNASISEKAAARMLLVYMLDFEPQKAMHVTAKNAVPINKDAYKTFKSINSKYKILDDYLGKLVFYPDSQTKLKNISENIAEEVVNGSESVDEWIKEQ